MNQGAAGEQIDKTQEISAPEEFGQFGRVHARHRDMRPQTKHHHHGQRIKNTLPEVGYSQKSA